MSLPRFYTVGLPQNGTLALDPQEARHAVAVRRLSAGDAIELFDGRGGVARAVIVKTDRRNVEVEIIDFREEPREPAWNVHLYAALPKGDRQRWMVDALTQLGVSRLTPLQTRRSVVQPNENALQRLRRVVIEACKQSGRNYSMEIDTPVTLEELCTLAGETNRERLKLFGHMSDTARPAGELLQAGANDNVSVVIGPEGGLTDEEIRALVNNGWQPMRLAAHTLRIEVAALVVPCWLAATKK